MPPSSTDSPWWSWFASVQDDQRLERLRYCQQLETILQECRASSSSPTAKNTTTNKGDRDDTDAVPDPIEGVSAGLRMMKYFGWRGILNSSAVNIENKVISGSASETDLDEKTVNHIHSTCAREEHAVWACRSVAIGCGKDLGAMKKCFDHHGPEVVLTESATEYETSTTDSAVPCGDLQRTLGDCVTRGANDLLERHRQRKKEDS